MPDGNEIIKEEIEEEEEEDDDDDESEDNSDENAKTSKPKNFSCPKCNKSYSREFFLDRHIKTDCGQRAGDLHICKVSLLFKMVTQLCLGGIPLK